MKRALVTGGSGAIGAAICRTLAESGHHVYVHGYGHAADAQRVAESIVAAGGSAETVLFDVADRDAAANAVGHILDAGVVQVLVNNAGTHDDAPFAAMTRAQWDRVIDVVLNGFFNVTQPLVMPMLRSRWGRIINIASVAATMGNRGQANYAAAKAGLIAAGKSLSHEIARKGVTVNAVAPGIIDTPMTASVPKNPLFAQPEAVGRTIYRAIEKRKDVVYVPGFWALIMFVIRSVPEPIFKKLKL